MPTRNRPDRPARPDAPAPVPNATDVAPVTGADVALVTDRRQRRGKIKNALQVMRAQMDPDPLVHPTPDAFNSAAAFLILEIITQ